MQTSIQTATVWAMLTTILIVGGCSRDDSKPTATGAGIGPANAITGLKHAESLSKLQFPSSALSIGAYGEDLRVFLAFDVEESELSQFVGQSYLKETYEGDASDMPSPEEQSLSWWQPHAGVSLQRTTGWVEGKRAIKIWVIRVEDSTARSGKVRVFVCKFNV